MKAYVVYAYFSHSARKRDEPFRIFLYSSLQAALDHNASIGWKVMISRYKGRKNIMLLPRYVEWVFRQ